MNITDYLVEKSQGLIRLEPETLNYGNSYSMANSASPETEVLEFLYALVKILKPQKILDTGTAFGLSSAWMAQGLKDNGFGGLTTIEYNKDMIKQAENLWTKLELTNWITSIQGLSYNFQPKEEYELILLDTEPQVRFKELELFYPYLKEGGFALIHDLNRDMSQNTHNPEHPEVDPWPFNKFSDGLKEKIRNGELTKVHFGTPRGLTMFYKVHSGDYKI